MDELNLKMSAIHAKQQIVSSRPSTTRQGEKEKSPFKGISFGSAPSIRGGRHSLCHLLCHPRYLGSTSCFTSRERLAWSTCDLWRLFLLLSAESDLNLRWVSGFPSLTVSLLYHRFIDLSTGFSITFWLGIRLDWLYASPSISESS